MHSVWVLLLFGRVDSFWVPPPELGSYRIASMLHTASYLGGFGYGGLLVFTVLVVRGIAWIRGKGEREDRLSGRPDLSFLVAACDRKGITGASWSLWMDNS
jgi:hypothetical protein